MPRKKDHGQLEFEWIGLHLVTVPEPTWDEMERTRQKVCWPPPRDESEAARLRDLTVRLSWLEMHYDENRVSLNKELGRARVLLGSEEWARSKKFWRRLAKRNPLSFLKILLVAQKENQL